MKNLISLSRVVTVAATIACVPPSFAQPPGPLDPRRPGVRGPVGPVRPGPGPVRIVRPRPRVILPIVPPRPIPPRVVAAPALSLTAQVQKELRRLGYYEGSVDGQIGPMTRSAIRGYQEENGLEVTDSIDKALLSSLGL